MFSSIFYDPNRCHPKSILDQDIEYVRDEEIFRQLTNGGNGVQQIVYICSSEKSAVIEKLLEKEQIIFIYLCGNRDHCEPEENPLYSSKVIADVILTEDSGWECQGRLDLSQFCMNEGYDVQCQQENERYRRIKLITSSIFPLSVEEISLSVSLK